MFYFEMETIFPFMLLSILIIHSDVLQFTFGCFTHVLFSLHSNLDTLHGRSSMKNTLCGILMWKAN